VADRRRASATTARRATPRATSRRRSSGFRLTGPNWQISPEVARSLVGILLLITGAVTLIALVLPGQGRLTDLWRDWIAPWFGTGRWLLPFVLLSAGVYVERARTRPGGWELRLVGATIAFIAALGLIELIGDKVSGGRIGILLADLLGGMITRPGAFVVLVGVAVAGMLIMLDLGLGAFLAPLARGLGSLREALGTASEVDPPVAKKPAEAKATGRRATTALPDGEQGLWDQGDGRSGGPASLPPAMPSAPPVSSTFAS
jgi:hypothetical protein